MESLEGQAQRLALCSCFRAGGSHCPRHFTYIYSIQGRALPCSDTSNGSMVHIHLLINQILISTYYIPGTWCSRLLSIRPPSAYHFNIGCCVSGSQGHPAQASWRCCGGSTWRVGKSWPRRDPGSVSSQHHDSPWRATVRIHWDPVWDVPSLALGPESSLNI